MTRSYETFEDSSSSVSVERPQRSRFKQFLRYVVGAAHIVTGVGVARLFAKTFTVNEGEIGVTKDKGKYALYPPGRYTLLSANHNHVENVSTKDVVTQLDSLEIMTSDSIALNVEADLIYQIEDPQKVITNVENYQFAIKQTAESTLREVISSHKLDDLLPDAMAQLNKPGNGPVNPEILESTSETYKESAARSSLIDILKKEFIQKFSNSVKSWGIKVKGEGLRIVKIIPKDPGISEAAGKARSSILNAQAEQAVAAQKALIIQTEAEAGAKAKEIQATGDAKAMQIIADQAIKTAATIASLPNEAQQRIAADLVKLEMWQKFAGRTNPTLYSNMGPNLVPVINSSSTSPAAFFPGSSGRSISTTSEAEQSKKSGKSLTPN